MNNCKLNNGKIKLGGYKGGRGYCGYYTTRFGKKIYLRSTQEFVYAKYLDRLGKYYLTENIIYEIDGKKYKPDFFVYDGKFEKLTTIIEIKYTGEEKSEYQRNFSEYFRKHNIEYNVLSRGDVKQLIKSGIVSKQELEEWKNEFVKKYNKFDYSGEKNPMFGVKHSEKTKRKIGKKTIEYFKDELVRKRHKESRDRFWESAGGGELKYKYAKLRHQESLIKNPMTEKICKFCGKKYSKKLKDRFHKETCSNSCQQKLNWRTGKNSYRGGSEKTYKTKIKRYFDILARNSKYNITNGNYDNLVQYQKSINNIPANFGMGVAVVCKYFGSLSNLKKETGYCYKQKQFWRK